MEIKDLKIKAKEIWGNENLNLSQSIVRLGKIYGDICRWERNAVKDSKTNTDDELKKEIRNFIFSSTRFADELGYDPEECI